MSTIWPCWDGNNSSVYLVSCEPIDSSSEPRILRLPTFNQFSSFISFWYWIAPMYSTFLHFGTISNYFVHRTSMRASCLSLKTPTGAVSRLRPNGQISLNLCNRFFAILTRFQVYMSIVQHLSEFSFFCLLNSYKCGTIDIKTCKLVRFLKNLAHI